MLHLTPSRLQVLNLLSFTMVTAHMLVEGGIYHDPTNKEGTNLRNAQRALQRLHEMEYIGYKKFPIVKTGSFRQFYYIKESGIQILEKIDFHKINDGLVEHDSITALFLVHLFRCCSKRNISLRWHQPFKIGEKRSDGGITIEKNGKRYTIIIETDTGNHAHSKIREKLQSYLPYLSVHWVIFLVSGYQRKHNLQMLFKKVLTAEQYKKISFFCPLNFPPNIDLFNLKHYKIMDL